MGKKNAKGKNRLDKYYIQAKEQGYRSRASYKLIQIEAKYNILNASKSVLDLCAAPGGWVQVAVEKAPTGALVIGVDLVKITPIGRAICVQEDITQPKCCDTINKLLGQHGFKAFDLVLHDGSPNIGGAWAQEATSQNSLVIDSLKIATQFLAPRGNFVTKVFRSQDYNAVVYCLRKFFDKVEVFKPSASRLSSAEIYVIGLRYKAPAKIDPRMLDIKYLFAGAAEPQKVIDVLDGGKQKRHRDGYEDGLTLVRKIRSASDFVWADNPVEMLGITTSISFNYSSSLPLKENSLTTEEVITLCEDLSVLGKQDFKHLLKWRIAIRKAISSAEKPTATVEAVKENESVDKEEGDEDEKLLDEMEELTEAIKRKEKREKKIQAKRRAKDKARKATGMQIDAMQDGYVDNELFSLGSIKGKDDLATVDETDDVDFSKLSDSDDNAENEADDDGDEPSDLDSDEERERYDEKLEKLLDEAYEQYVTRTDGSTKQRKRAKKAYDEQPLEEIEDADEIAEPDVSDKDESNQDANPLLVPIDEETRLTQDDLRLQWFSNDIFVEAVEEGDLRKDESDDDIVEVVRKQKVSAPTKTSSKSLVSETSKKRTAIVEETKVQDSKLMQRSETSRKRTAIEEDELEVVPAPGNSSDSSSSDESEYDSDTMAELRAIGRKMVGNKRKRQEMEDMAYNKWIFDDDLEALPKCIQDDFRAYYQPPKIVTKEERQAEKAMFSEIDKRPAKKVAEAKARKKRVAMRNLEKVRKKADSIADQTDINDRSKRRMIDQLYKKATPKKPGKEKVVAKKGVQVRPGKGKVLVDRRMKKDARQHGMQKKANNLKTKGKGNGKGKGKSSSKRSTPTGKNAKMGKR
ncbi:adoMet-dependent rRNA methyltransferase spb1-like [Silene latifolia]|uniref:adoMet-dependent rRNA methyltransferase spb1-like n=1 Tax=Silene latifolia TaxID=37657 RepID=UPI003D76A4FD